jgi:hypothetical protein
MPTFREVTTGQVVEVEDDPSYFTGLARWERIEVGLSAPVAGDPWVPFKETAPTPTPEPEPAQAVDDGEEVPGEDANRDAWIAYALANGKTEADVKGVRTTVIASWFTDNK